MPFRARLSIVIAVCCGLLSTAAAAQSVIWVDARAASGGDGSVAHPLRTLRQAQQLARQWPGRHAGQPLEVRIRGGIYYLDSTLVFDGKDVRHGPLIFRAYPGEKVVVSGARVLRLRWHHWKGGIYRATVPPDLDIDQLYIGGIRQVNARYPNRDTLAPIFDGVSKNALSPQRIRSWKRPEGGYIHALQVAHWGSLHYRISGRDPRGNLLLEGGYQINRSRRIDSAAVFVENILEELDTLQEWYTDRQAHQLYIYPADPAALRHATVEVPVLRQLVVMQGDTAHPLRNLHFEGITFMHTRETFMDTREPLLRGDWNIFRGGAILLSGTEHCSFSHCRFEQMGGNVLFFSGYNRYDTVQHCLISHAGASGICFVGDPSAVRSPAFRYEDYVPYAQLDKQPGPRNSAYPRDCYVFDNLIHHTGLIEKQSAGIHLSMSSGIDVVNNTIYHVPRAGININDGTWGGHRIVNNDVFQTVLETGDHGAFNSWGRDRYWAPQRPYMDSLAAVHPELILLDAVEPVLLRHNRFRCDHGWDIDLDDGSSHYIIDSNLCLQGGIKLREGFYRQVRNNIMLNNSFHPHVWFDNSRAVFQHNIVMRPYAPIQIRQWGDSIDHNVFPDTMSLAVARRRGTDLQSVAALPRFVQPSTGNYALVMTPSLAAAGFRNFRMDNFGVLSPEWRAMIPARDFPAPTYANRQVASTPVRRWQGALLKAVSDENERSALGLPDASGVFVIRASGGSGAPESGLRQMDVVLQIGDIRIHSLDDIDRALKSIRDKDHIRTKVFRNQQVLWLILSGDRTP